jgi:Arc/MetJ-type ribon-helix-helix transcriptional regulator
MPGKRVSASEMLNRGRARTAGAELPASAPAGSTATSERQDVETSKYKRVTVYLTAEQRQWAKQAARAAGDESLSASDVIRLAVTRLQQAQADGLDLGRELAEQAWAEVAVYRGRAKRGLPPRPDMLADRR